jgi:methyl-accepting chemotaxis protein
MKIYQKFILAFSILTAIVWALGFVALYTFHQMDDQVTILNNDIIPGAFSMLETNVALVTLGNEMAEFLITEQPEHRGHIKKAIAVIKNNVEKHAAHEIHLGEEEHQTALEMENRAKEIIQLAEQVIHLKQAGSAKTKINALQRQMHLKREELVAILEQHVKIHNDELKIARMELQNLYNNGTQLVWITLFIVMLLLLGIGFILSGSVAKPLNYLVQVFHAIAEGHLDNEIDTGRKDEMGQLLKAFTNMQTQLRERIEEDKRIADEALRINEALENVTTCVLITDTHSQIIYANQAAQQLFKQAEKIIRQTIPHFQVNHLVGLPIEVFLPNAESKETFLPNQITTYQTLVTLDHLKWEVNITPVLNTDKQHLGFVAEFRDRTAEIVTEQEVNTVVSAASQGDFSQRIYLTDKTGFFKTFSEGLNQTLDKIQQMTEELHQVFTALAHGNLNQTITQNYTGSLELLKNDVNATINKLSIVMEGIQQAAEAASQGNFGQCINLADKEGFFATLSEQLNQILDANQLMTDELMQVFAAIAGGDLTKTITSNYVGILERLKMDVNVTVIKLTEVINTVQQSAEIVTQATKEISQGNTNLSQRTEQQAASLEETVASMEEMTGTVQQNADNAQQANQLATTARNYAETGGNVIETAITAMTGINQSSQKVADIIGVIDEIAFQTNLLALNAAVEAARAGDQGRGFAVVATEVRNLAQRSAAAAKEIKSLIQDSVNKVDEGTRLVNQSGETLKKIVQAAQKVSDIISEIAAASREQTSGINQINKVVSQLDQMTQQNSALVEEAATTSEMLKEQVQSLKEQVAFFNTGKGIKLALGNHLPQKTIISKTSLKPNHVIPKMPKHFENDEEWKDF